MRGGTPRAADGSEGQEPSQEPSVALLLARFACNNHTICDDELAPIGAPHAPPPAVLRMRAAGSLCRHRQRSPERAADTETPLRACSLHCRSVSLEITGTALGFPTLILCGGWRPAGARRHRPVPAGRAAEPRLPAHGRADVRRARDPLPRAARPARRHAGAPNPKPNSCPLRRSSSATCAPQWRREPCFAALPCPGALCHTSPCTCVHPSSAPMPRKDRCCCLCRLLLSVHMAKLSALTLCACC